MKDSRKDSQKCPVAYFISPHGFGHAARASGVMEAVLEVRPSTRFELFTTAPSWFFEDSLSAPFSYYPLLTDIGMVQHTPLREDLLETIRHLNDFLPFQPSLIAQLARQLRALECRLVICDIAPMGILVAQHAGIPSVLIENFTWDWIYDGYAAHGEQMAVHVDYLRDIFHGASCHIQTEPVCAYRKADLVTPPVCRKARTSPKHIRKQLAIPVDKKVILITMGGIEMQYDFTEALRLLPDVYFVIPGGSHLTELTDNLVLLPHHSDFYHPDLVNASDGVVGKLGYSTLAEVYHAGVPFGHISRRDFPESEILARFVDKEMAGLAIEEEDFHSGKWISKVPILLGLIRNGPVVPNGSQQIAAHICTLLQS
jgi:UDP:flavonoid glycosyltransferase YjiC (YdhE family)